MKKSGLSKTLKRRQRECLGLGGGDVAAGTAATLWVSAVEISNANT